MTSSLLLLPLLTVLACKDGEEGDSADTCCDPADGGGDAGSDGGGTSAQPWTLVPLDPVTETLTGLTEARQVFRAAGNDYVYVLNNDGSQLRYITQAWVQADGDYCVEGPGTPTACNGTLLTAGRINATAVSPAVCLDDEADSFYLVKDGGGRVEVARTNRDGASWAFYNRIYASRQVEKDADDDLDGPCAAQGGRLAMSSASEVLVMDAAATTIQIATRIAYQGGIAGMEFVGDSAWLAVHGVDGSVWIIDSTTGEKAANLTPAGDTAVMAVDPQRGAVWTARVGDGRLLRTDLTENGAAAPVVVGAFGAVHQMAVDHRTGAVHALVACESCDSGYQLIIVGEDGLHATQELTDTPLALIPPGWMGQLAALVRTDPTTDSGGTQIPSEVQIRAWYVHDPADTRPPLSVFVVSTLEEPFSSNPKTCTPAENPNDNFEALLDQLRANIPVLQATGLPVAIGVTWEFLNNAEYCDELSIIQELHDAGFSLGYMVHDKPCYSCTNGDVPGETPDQCNPNDMDFAAAASASACWPSDEDYCTRGDQDCWFQWTNKKQLDVDTWLQPYGGSQFIFGADRHKLWGWEYIRGGYRIYDRADGSQGYGISLFQGSWVYEDIVDTDDPRAKDSAPWHPERMGSTWYPADVASWEEDSAFSELLYMPGNSVALARLRDWQQSDLGLIHLFDEVTPLVAEQDDFDTLVGLLAQPLAHRGQRPGTHYFHLPDLTGYPLKPEEGDDRMDYSVALPAWRDRVDALYGSAGLGITTFQGPEAVKAQVDAFEASR
jgi:hypothetical protein